ncbi:DinB family protein [Bacillus sp. 31A1R]|uniref:DinB family protein n=1 Tax=Robertmurraya mangrovi TaxID=3098077 RepID=A0ABU5IWK8_9BACI|nr:DinB family protein [Bacillus sp. 31A1R]MDZ5471533.1 DinB family protein [Bacillus sp. 31A1R]
MDKEQIVKRKLLLTEWAKKLYSIPDEVWFKPFNQGTWGTADVISHFISWDQFLIENRLPFLLREESFPAMVFDSELINKSASEYARSGISKENLLSEFILIRKSLVSLIELLPLATFKRPYPLKKDISISEYFIGLINHDLKHKEQIDEFLNSYY